jgi:hypothetical protein
MAVAWTRGRRARSVLDIELISPYGQALRDPGQGTHRLSAPGLDRPEGQENHPEGQESSHIDLDAEMNDLLRQAS